jgi:riboflavin biosynthesis pyrimidine reductase
MLAPFEQLYAGADEAAARLLLPPELLALYGELAFPVQPDRPYVISNFVSTLDGVVSLGIPVKAGGGEISGFNAHDRALMGLLRAAADAVVVGAGTLRAVPRHLWTADYVFPELSEAFQALRRSLGRGPTPLNVILSGSGQVGLSSPVFASGEVTTLIVTTSVGTASLQAQNIPSRVTVRAIDSPDNHRFSAAAVLAEVAAYLGQPAPLVLLEGGPQVMGDFFAERRIDELFLTLAPQVAGRADGAGLAERPGLVAGRVLAPHLPTWSTLVSTHRAGSHLFLRYRFEHASMALDDS